MEVCCSAQRALAVPFILSLEEFVSDNWPSPDLDSEEPAKASKGDACSDA